MIQPTSPPADPHRHLVSVPATGPSTLRPDYALPPGHLLRRELDAHGISQAELAARTGLSAKHVNQVVQGAAPLSIEMSLLLERVLGIPSHVWTGLDIAYREAELRAESRKRLTGYSDWADQFDRKLLAERGIVQASDDGVRVVDKLLSFFAVADPDSYKRVWDDQLAAFHRTHTFQVDEYAAAVWLRLAELSAATIPLCPYSAKSLRVLLPRLRELTVDPLEKTFTTLRQKCAGVGVAIVRELPPDGARICGATRWINGSHPIIVLSGSYRVEDSFWFSFFHEIGHIVKHPKRATYVAPDKDQEKDEIERDADEYAESVLIPSEWNERLRLLKNSHQVGLFAKEIGVHSGIVAGRLINDGRPPSNYDDLRRQMPTIASTW